MIINSRTKIVEKKSWKMPAFPAGCNWTKSLSPCVAS